MARVRVRVRVDVAIRDNVRVRIEVRIRVGVQFSGYQFACHAIHCSLLAELLSCFRRAFVYTSARSTVRIRLFPVRN